MLFTAQLSTCRADIRSSALSDDGGIILFEEYSLELAYLLVGRRVVTGARMGVEGDKINLRSDPGQQFCKIQGISFTVIDAIYQDIFKSDPISLWEWKFFAGVEEAF